MLTNPTAKIIIIGNEILSGRVADANINFLATELHSLGIELVEVSIIGDNKNQIIDKVKYMCKDCDYLFTTGGVGPTHDDITTSAVAAAFGVEIFRNHEAEQLLLQRHPNIQGDDARMKMADLPVGARLIYNSATVAPGFILENVYVMAGIPYIMQAMFHGLKNKLKKGLPYISRSITNFLPESAIAKDFATLQAKFSNIMMGSYPAKEGEKWRTTLVLTGIDEEMIECAFDDLKTIIINLNGEIVE